MILRKHNFIKWLESKEPREYVGERGKGCHCPLAEYLTARTGAPHGVGTAYGPVSSMWGNHKSAFWMLRFMSKVDNGNGGTGRVQAKTALRYMREIG